MDKSTIIKIIRNYFIALSENGIHPRRAILYGSHAREEADEWSDIDLIIIAPEFDLTKNQEIIGALWKATLYADNRIEPIPCGEKEWETDESRPILEIARNEGIEISV